MLWIYNSALSQNVSITISHASGIYENYMRRYFISHYIIRVNRGQYFFPLKQKRNESFVASIRSIVVTILIRLVYLMIFCLCFVNKNSEHEFYQIIEII